MKFRTLFVLFNIVLFFAFLSIFFLPFFAVSTEFMLDYWKTNPFIPVFFLACLVALNAAFMVNWPVLSLLEREDWPALASYLETRVLSKGSRKRRDIRLFIESHILLGDFTPVVELSDRLKRSAPALWASFAPRFSGSLILAGRVEGAGTLAREALSLCAHAPTREWTSFYAGLSSFLSRDFVSASRELSSLARRAKDPLVTALAGHMCALMAERDKDGHASLGEEAHEARARVLRRFSARAWKRYLERERGDIRVVLLGKLTEQAGQWLFPAG